MPLRAGDPASYFILAFVASYGQSLVIVVASFVTIAAIEVLGGQPINRVVEAVGSAAGVGLFIGLHLLLWPRRRRSLPTAPQDPDN